MFDLKINPMSLEGEDQGRLVLVLDASLKVKNEKQFYAWAQCELQYLMSHEILVCCMAVGTESVMKYYYFSSTPEFTKEHLAELCAPHTGLLSQMMRHTEIMGAASILGSPVRMGNYHESWIPLLERHNLVNAVAHGLTGSDNRLKSYFCFFRVHEKLDERTRYLLDILLPILDSTLSRVAAESGCMAVQLNAGMLGKRHMQVLVLLKAGKSNHEIAQQLELSPLTVKNHVQKIMKKLKVNSRGHAVIQAINIGLLNHR